MANKRNIPDELLAAFLDGQTDGAETRQVLAALREDSRLREAVEIALQVDETTAEAMEGQCAERLCPAADMSQEAACCAANFMAEALPMSERAAADNRNLCGVQCEAYVLRKRGLPADVARMADEARAHGWLTDEGMPLHAMGQLLADKGLPVVRRYAASVEDIEKALRQENQVLVAVDREKLYPGMPDEDDAPNHAVAVTAIGHGGVTLYDPLTCAEGETKAVPLPCFLRAWDESQRYMVQVLRTVAQYDPQPMDLAHVPLGDELDELREAIAEHAHDAWAAARRKEGWTYGPVRDDRRKQHPDLVPYASLPEGEKEYDRLMATNTIKLLKKLGFEVVKRRKQPGRDRAADAGTLR